MLMSPPSTVRSLFDATVPWIGCHWETEYGPLCLNLKGVTAVQARLMSRATACAESQAWEDAADWLDGLQHEAHEARNEARLAVAMADLKRWREARVYIARAVARERQAHGDSMWRELQHAIESAAEAADFCAGDCCHSS